MRILVALALLAGVAAGVAATKWEKPSFCGSHDCPIYDVTYTGKGFETRAYANSTWAIAPVLSNASPFEGVQEAHARLLRYLFKGANEENATIVPGVPFLTFSMPSIPDRKHHMRGHRHHHEEGAGIDLFSHEGPSMLGAASAIFRRARDALGLGPWPAPSRDDAPPQADTLQEGLAEAVRARFAEDGETWERRMDGESKNEDGEASGIGPHHPPHRPPHRGPHGGCGPHRRPSLFAAVYLPYEYQSIDGAEPEKAFPAPTNASGVFVATLPESHVQVASFGGFASPRSFFRAIHKLLRATFRADQPADPGLGLTLAVYDCPATIEDRHNEVMITAVEPSGGSKRRHGKGHGKKHRKDRKHDDDEHAHDMEGFGQFAAALGSASAAI